MRGRRGSGLARKAAGRCRRLRAGLAGTGRPSSSRLTGHPPKGAPPRRPGPVRRPVVPGDVELTPGRTLSFENRLRALLISQRIMIHFLWRLAVLAGTLGLELAFGGLGLLRESLSSTWWAARHLRCTALMIRRAVRRPNDQGHHGCVEPGPCRHRPGVIRRRARVPWSISARSAASNGHGPMCIERPSRLLCRTAPVASRRVVGLTSLGSEPKVNRGAARVDW